jgi:hypothetical protein
MRLAYRQSGEDRLMASTCDQSGGWPARAGGGFFVPFVIQVLQSLVVLGFAPLYAGAISRAEAIVGSKRGPSLLQPYRDLGKLLRKASAFSDQASWVSRGAPFVAFSCYLTVSVIVPVITNTPLPLAFLGDLIGGAFVLALASFAISLAGLDTASPYGGLGASRASWIGSMAERPADLRADLGDHRDPGTYRQEQARRPRRHNADKGRP